MLQVIYYILYIRSIKIVEGLGPCRRGQEDTPDSGPWMNPAIVRASPMPQTLDGHLKDGSTL